MSPQHAQLISYGAGLLALGTATVRLRERARVHPYATVFGLKARTALRLAYVAVVIYVLLGLIGFILRPNAEPTYVEKPWHEVERSLEKKN